MTKREFGPQPWIFPNPTVLIGTVYNGKPNFAPFAWCGIAGGEPPMVAIGVRHQRHTLKGIMQNKSFSANIPSTTLLEETDYCGIVSGAQVDKIKICGFKVFYGKPKNTPMIEQCPVNLECKVVHMLNIGAHMLVVGKVIETHVDEDCLTEDQPDILKIKPFVYSRGPTARYNAVGKVLGQAYDAGKKLKNRDRR